MASITHHDTDTEPTRCRKCRRILRRPTPDGLGPKCRAKTRRDARTIHGFEKHQIDSALELIEDGGIIRVRRVKAGLVFETVSSDGTETHLTTDAGHCTCPAGRRSVRCYHTAAALLLAA